MILYYCNYFITLNQIGYELWVLQKRGFKKSFDLCDDIWDLIRANQRIDFCLTPKKSTIN